MGTRRSPWQTYQKAIDQQQQHRHQHQRINQAHQTVLPTMRTNILSPTCQKCNLKHPNHWIYCDVEGCQRCHPGGRDRCNLLHKELRRSRYHNNNKNNTNTNETTSPTQSQPAAPTISNWRSGLTSPINTGQTLSHLSMAKFEASGLDRDTLIKDSGSSSLL